MARSPQTKLNTAAEFANNNTGFYSAALARVDSTGNIDSIGANPFVQFLLNPATYEETKTSNWIPHNIPGQSDPILQWVSSGARTITFDALITKDTSYFPIKDASLLGGLENKVLSVVGNIASSFAGVNLPSIASLFGSSSQGVGEDLSITDYLNYYRSLLYPTYDADTSILVQSPPLLALIIGKSTASEVTNAITASTISRDTELWVLTSLKIRITKQLPNLTPMKAIASFTLEQYVINSKNASDIDTTFAAG